MSKSTRIFFALAYGLHIVWVLLLASVPPVSRDALTHHLALPKLWIQRGGLNEIAGEYRPAYEEMSRQMVELSSSREQGAGGMEVDWQAQERRQAAMSKLRFDRDELSARAANRMRLMLTEAQIAAIGGLPDPPERRFWWE